MAEQRVQLTIMISTKNEMRLIAVEQTEAFREKYGWRFHPDHEAEMPVFDEAEDGWEYIQKFYIQYHP
jgi:hypothetical protein